MIPYAPIICRCPSAKVTLHEQPRGSFAGEYDMHGESSRRAGWWFYKWNVTIYSVRLNSDFPMTYRDVAGAYWRTSRLFTSDLASIPPVSQLAIPKDGAILRPALLHDDAYDTHALFHSVNGEDFSIRALTRAQADDLLREMCVVEGMTAWRVEAVFRAVRIFGGAAWADRGRTV